MSRDSALILMDMQNDFCEGGVMPVPGADSLVPIINEYMIHFNDKDLAVFTARDWHEFKTKHFQEWGGLWPPHCLRGSNGAAFHPDLKFLSNTVVLTKGDRPDRDGHTLFEATDFTGNPVSETFRARGVKHLYICGIATDYGIMVSVLDALDRGMKVTLLIDAIKGVDATPGDSEQAIKDMIAKGAKTATIDEIDVILGTKEFKYGKK